MTMRRQSQYFFKWRITAYPRTKTLHSGPLSGRSLLFKVLVSQSGIRGADNVEFVLVKHPTRVVVLKSGSHHLLERPIEQF